MAIIDTTYVDNSIGITVRQAVTGSSTTVFDQLEEMARVKVKAACLSAGYTIGDSETNATIKLLVLGQWMLLAYGLRKGIEIPPAIQDAINMLELVRTGKMPIPGLSPDPQDAVGGSKWSDSSQTSTSTRAPRFSRSELDSW